MNTIYNKCKTLKDWVIFRLFERLGEIAKKKYWGGNTILCLVLYIESTVRVIRVFNTVLSLSIIIDKILMIIHYLLMQHCIIRWYFKNPILIGGCTFIVFNKEMIWFFSWLEWHVVKKHFCRNNQYFNAIRWFVDDTSFVVNVNHSF